MQNDKTIFVTGGTGNQGGAVAKNLLHHGFTVKVLTRNPGSAKALKLENLNIQLVKGDLNNSNTYREHLKDAYGVFSVQTFENGVDKEISQGITLATEAEKAGIRHFLYSSVAGAQPGTGVPHIESKFKIENYIRGLGLPFTIIRPAGLYENFLIPQVKKGILKGTLLQPVSGEIILQYLAAEDIGNAALKIFSNTPLYLSRTIPLATEELSAIEIAAIFSDVLAKKITYRKLPALLTRIFMGKSLYRMFKLMNEGNFFSAENMADSRKEFPGLISLRNWIEMNFKS